MGTTIRTVRDLPNVRLVKAEDIWGNVPDDPTEGDATWSYGSWVDDTTETTHALINYTLWSDYSGSTVERSNERSLREDYPGTFVKLYGGYGTSGLMLPVDRPTAWFADDDDGGLERWQSLLEDLAHLEDYPLYSDDDHSALETEIADEAWDAYARADLLRDLASAGVPDDALADDATLRARFYALTYSQNYGPECETADSCYFPFWDTTVATLAAELTGGGRS